MVTTEETAGPSGIRLCLSVHVINTCSYSKYVLKKHLSVAICLQRDESGPISNEAFFNS